MYEGMTLLTRAGTGPASLHQMSGLPDPLSDRATAELRTVGLLQVIS